MASPAITAITATMDAVPKRSSSTVWNSTAWTTIRTAAYAGMKFDPGDFGLIVRRYGRALGVDSIERLYSLSCGIRSAAPESRIRPNTSAARSIERFLQRRPFMFFEHGGPKAPRRAAVGLVFPWPPEGLWLHLTSFAADGETIIGTAYRDEAQKPNPARECAIRIADEHLERLWAGTMRDAVEPAELQSFRNWQPDLDPMDVRANLRDLTVRPWSTHGRTVKRRVRITRADLRAEAKPDEA